MSTETANPVIPEVAPWRAARTLAKLASGPVASLIEMNGLDLDPRAGLKALRAAGMVYVHQYSGVCFPRLTGDMEAMGEVLRAAAAR